MSRRITFVTGSMGRGGAERVISLLSRYYADQGWTVDIAMLLHGYNDYSLDARVNVLNFSHPQGIKRGLLQTLSRFRKYVRQSRPDVVVCFMAQNCLLTGLATTGINIPMVMSERIDPAEVHRNPVYQALLNHYYSTADKVIFQTQRARNYFSKKIQENSCIIGNPICVATEKAAAYSHRIVTAGRMTEQKNQAMLISAFAEIHESHPEYRLTIYGDGPLMEQLKEQRNTLNLEDAVDFPGNVPNLHEQMADAEIFVLPSNFEGLSNALLEAMMMGLPVIATNCAGCDEVIENGKNGLLIQVGDQNGLVGALNTLIEDEEYRTVIARNGQQSVQRFRVDEIIHEWDQVISDCCCR